MVDRWEYLTVRPYTVRHHLANYFVARFPVVVDVGVYKTVLDVPGVYHRIDPLDTAGGFTGSVAAWWDQHRDLSGFALVILGMALEGDEAEATALLEMAEAADLVVVEWATQYRNPLVEPMVLTFGKTMQAMIRIDLPELDTPGFPVFSQRVMVVASK